MTQDAVTVEGSRGPVHLWRLRVAWDGSVAGLLRVSPREEAGDYQVMYPEYETILVDPLFDEGLGPLGQVVEGAARGIGGYGRAHVVLRMISRQFSVRHSERQEAFSDEETLRTIQRWAEGDPWLDDHLLDGMKRELLRACGFPEWEPGP